MKLLIFFVSTVLIIGLSTLGLMYFQAPNFICYFVGVLVGAVEVLLIEATT